MRPAALLLVLPPFLSAGACLLAGACASTDKARPAESSKPTASAGASTGPAAPTPLAKPATPPSMERPGVFAPAAPAAVSLWFEAYAGEMLVLEAMPQGSEVKEGDVLARLETKSIDEQVHQAELEAASSAVRHQGVVEKNRIDEDAAAAALEQAKAALDRAKKTLDGWTQKELAFNRRGDEISKKNEDAGIDDQKDELAQLEKMYKADELVDATEEIVLKRAKRRLAISEDARTLSVDRRGYKIDYDEAMQTEVKKEAAKMQELALDRLVRTQAVEKRAREDALLRSKDALDQQAQRLEKLHRDREKFVVKAPRGGILLHGKEKDYRPGRTPARYERGSQLPARTDVFLVADPAAVAVAFDVPESMLGEAREGAAVEVKAIAPAGASGIGTVHLEAYPGTKVGEENGWEATAKLSSAIPGVLFGTRAKVVLGGAAMSPPSTPSSTPAPTAAKSAP
jgi:hypothetical protein